MKLLFALLLLSVTAQSQVYKYSLDLNGKREDSIEVSLITPKVTKPVIDYYFPKIIPGTYQIADYGKFISGLKAFDKSGKALPVSRVNDNRWKISNATGLYKITYVVEDVFDTKQTHNIYPMSATNIEANKNYVLNTFGFFGYLAGMNRIPIELTINKPEGFYASTSLTTRAVSPTADILVVANLDELYDNPIMYTTPDTTTMQIGNCRVLVSVYSGKQLIHSKEVAEWLNPLLVAAKNYLGGKLPADKYSFLYYFWILQQQTIFQRISSERLNILLLHSIICPMFLANIKNFVIDVSSHEFFHIITPLTIASKEVKVFNYDLLLCPGIFGCMKE